MLDIQGFVSRAEQGFKQEGCAGYFDRRGAQIEVELQLMIIIIINQSAVYFLDSLIHRFVDEMSENSEKWPIDV